jgi:hypothetical protein
MKSKFKDPIYLIYGVQKKLSRYRQKSYKVFMPKPRFKGNIEQFFENLQALFDNYQTINPDWFESNDVDKVIEHANYTFDNKFDVLGSGLVKLDPIDWHSDFKVNFTWEQGVFYKDYIQVDLSNNADVKVPRELSRSHFLLWLGEAYLLTKETKYAGKIVEIINHWIDENPLMRSINWGCTMDVAIRVANWLFAVKMIQASDCFDQNFKEKLIQSVYEHAWFIENNHEKSFANNANHYDSNIVVQLLLGYLFRFDTKGRKWYDTAKELIIKEIRTQVLPSGVIYEKTISYIRLVQEMFTFAYLILKDAKEEIPNDVTHLIKETYKFSRNYQNGVEKVPNVGDQDNARFLPFGIYNHLDHKYLGVLGASLFETDEFLSNNKKYNFETFFLLGLEGRKSYNLLSEPRQLIESEMYPDAGFFIFNSEKINLFINNSGLGKLPDKIERAYSHTHADMLSFVLNVLGNQIFIDPGTHLYTSSREQRNLYRSTKYHNTIAIDGCDQYEISDKDLFSYNSKGYPHHLKYKTSSSKDIYCGEHNAYHSLNGKPTHRRSFHFYKEKSIIVINDLIQSTEEHDLEYNLFLDPNIIAEFKENKREVGLIAANKGFSIDLSFHSNCNYEVAIEDAFYSEAYGESSETKKICVKAFGKKSPFRLKTRIKVNYEK